ncbi:SRPBCC family protein [Actinomycetospora sp. TBRC 11914]|uniref:SRPBCC family protein n=1 Tax=Actinomycetospora sp. TBRC 11914 TaxID=2729387 RepID=UPI00289DAB63|nr:SRPBCC family protein [Actinomycetospora sp. TBRC 11914]
MRDEVSEYVAASPATVWDLVADVRNTGRLSPETFEAEWLDGATGPAVGNRFRGHVRRGGTDRNGPVYWTECRVTDCVEGREFGFDVVLGKRRINHWHYRFEPSGNGTRVTESFALYPTPFLRVYWLLAGPWRGRYNRRNMQDTLRRLKELAEAG